MICKFLDSFAESVVMWPFLIFFRPKQLLLAIFLHALVSMGREPARLGGGGARPWAPRVHPWERPGLTMGAMCLGPRSNDCLCCLGEVGIRVSWAVMCHPCSGGVGANEGALTGSGHLQAGRKVFGATVKL
jgi:hypothetical protein